MFAEVYGWVIPGGFAASGFLVFLYLGFDLITVLCLIFMELLDFCGVGGLGVDFRVHRTVLILETWVLVFAEGWYNTAFPWV